MVEQVQNISKDEILESISSMTVLELVELVKAIEDKFGVSATPVMAQFGGGMPSVSGSEPAKEEKTEFDISMTKYDTTKKIDVIKIIREITGLGLKESKDLVESCKDGAKAKVKSGVSKSEAEDIKKKLESANISVEIE